MRSIGRHADRCASISRKQRQYSTPQRIGAMRYPLLPTNTAPHFGAPYLTRLIRVRYGVSSRSLTPDDRLRIMRDLFTKPQKKESLQMNRFIIMLVAIAKLVADSSDPAAALVALRPLANFRERYGWLRTAFHDACNGRLLDSADAVRFLACRLEQAEKARQHDAMLVSPVRRVGKTLRKDDSKDAARLARREARSADTLKRQGRAGAGSKKDIGGGTSRKSVQKRRRKARLARDSRK